MSLTKSEYFTRGAFCPDNTWHRIFNSPLFYADTIIFEKHCIHFRIHKLEKKSIEFIEKKILKIYKKIQVDSLDWQIHKKKNQDSFFSFFHAKWLQPDISIYTRTLKESLVNYRGTHSTFIC